MIEPQSVLSFSSLEIREHGGLEAVRTLDAEALASIGADAPFAGAVEVRVEFSVGGKDVLLQGSATGAFRAECSRCLIPVTSPFSAPLEEQVYGEEVATIDVSGDVREAVMLSIPDKPLCRTDCKGLCAQCGQNLNERDCGHRPAPPNAFSKLKELKVRKKS